MASSLHALLWAVVALCLLSASQQAKNFKSDDLALAKEDLKIAQEMNERTKKLVHDLYAHIDRLGKRIRTGKTLRAVERADPKKDPFKLLRRDILQGDLSKTRAAPL